MRIQDKLVPYLEYCEYRKELDKKRSKHIGLICVSTLHLFVVMSQIKKKVEAYITELHKKV